MAHVLSGGELSEQLIVTSCKAEGTGVHEADEEDNNEKSTEQQFTDGEILTNVSHFYCSVKSLTDLHSRHPRLTTLYITGMSLDSLAGVETLQNLQELHAVKCKLRNVKVVEHCFNLEKLCLHSNAIQEIPDLKYLQNLQTLWLSGNEISCIKNLEGVKKLCELYLNNNKIKEIGSSLQENKALRTLNLASNPLFFLKEMRNLAKVPSVSSLILADPLHDAHSITDLSNYSSYIIQHLANLEDLDGYPVDQKERNRIKQFYKNYILQFRIQKYKLLGDYYKDVQIKHEEYREGIAKFRKCSQIYTSLASQLDKDQENKFKIQQDDIKTRLEHLSIEIRNWDAEMLEHMTFLSTLKKIRLSQLDYELQNADNLKFVEHETESELAEIFNSIMSCYCCSHIEREYDITGVKVIRVTQIVNNGFKIMLKSLWPQNLSRKKLTCLLVSPTPVNSFSDWPFTIVEKGFIGFKEFSVSVTDCLDCADASWMSTLRKLKQGNVSLTDQIQSSVRVAVIVQLLGEENFSIHRARILTLEKLSEANFGTHMHEPTDPKKCQVYHVRNSSDVIPAYIVEYRYKYKEDRLKILQQNMGLDIHSHYLSSQKYNAEPCQLNLETLEMFTSKSVSISHLREINIVGCSIRTIDENLPKLPSLISLNLSCNQITEVPQMDIFPRIKKLDLSYNSLHDFENFTVTVSLEAIDVSWNKISEILPVFRAIKTCAPYLKELNTFHNPIEDVTNLNHMLFFAVKYLSRLQTYNDKSATVFKKSLHNFNIEDHQSTHGCIQNEHEVAVVSLKWRAEWYNDIHNTENKEFMKHRICSSNWINVNDERISKIIIPNVNSELQWLDLSYNYVDDLSFFLHCPNAKEISLEHNVIIKFGHTLQTLKNVTHLNISQNYLTSLKEITRGSFPCLKLLDVSSNNITALDGIEYCTALQELYFSSNLITEYDDLNSIKGCRLLKIIDMTGNPVESKRNALSYIVYHNQNIEVVNGYQIQASDISEASQVFCGILDKNYLLKEMLSSDLSKLTEVTLTRCAIRKIDLPRDTLPSLISIDLSCNNITSLCGLHDLPQLQTLCLSGNKVTEMGLTEEQKSSENKIFPNLNRLFLDNNGVTSIVSLELVCLPKLTHLFLQCNMIDSIQGLQGLPNLIALVLDWNRITSVTRENVSTLSSLVELHLERNKIRSLSFLKELKKLQRLYLSYNKINDYDQLKYVSGLNHLEEVTLTANPICSEHTAYHDLTRIIPRFYIYAQTSEPEE